MDRVIVIPSKQYNVVLALAVILGVLAGFFGGRYYLLERQVSQARQASQERASEYIRLHREASETRFPCLDDSIIIVIPDDATEAPEKAPEYR